MSPYFSLIKLTSVELNIPVYWNIIILILLLFICGIFAGSENIFSNCNKYYFKVEANKKSKIGRVVNFLINHFDETLIDVLIVNNAIQYVMSFLMSNIIMDLFPTLQEGTDSLVSTLILSFLIYIFTDSLFKILGSHLPNKLAKAFGYIVFFFYIILFPLIMIFKGILILVRKIFKIKDKNLFTKEDFIIEADKAINDDNISEEKEELLEDEELSILNNAFNFDTISVSQVLKKRDEIFALDINNLTIDKLNQIILENNYSRIPIYDEKIDNIIGILTVRTYFKEYMADKHLNIVGCLTKPLYFEESTKVDEIFEEFNKTKNHLGFVVDKNKNLVGMVTMDDILEELVGDIDEIKINKLKENKHERKSN